MTTLLFSQVAHGDIASIVESCDGCHGAGGVSLWRDMPTIAGIDAFVHADALLVYRDDARPCAVSKFRQGNTDRPATDMCAVAKKLSDSEIQAVADYYAALPFVPAKQAYDEKLAAAGKKIHDRQCSRCHSAGGSDPADEASILAGQWMGYMESTFAEYASGERDQPRKMKDVMDALTAEDVQALLHYYASQQ